MELRSEMQYATGLIHKVACRMIGKAGLLEADLFDLQQDLWLDLLKRLPKYRAERGHIRVFISRVVNNKAASILKARRAAKRDKGRPSLSLDRELEGEDGEPTNLRELISVDDYLLQTRGVCRTQEERRDLAIDIRRAVDHLDPPHRAVCLLVIDRTVCDVANIVGLPRSTLRDLIKRLRLICKEMGLDDYVE